MLQIYTDLSPIKCRGLICKSKSPERSPPLYGPAFATLSINRAHQTRLFHDLGTTTPKAHQTRLHLACCSNDRQVGEV